MIPALIPFLGVPEVTISVGFLFFFFFFGYFLLRRLLFYAFIFVGKELVFCFVLIFFVLNLRSKSELSFR